MSLTAPGLSLRRVIRDFTFVCPTEILAFNDSLDAFKELNTTVLSTFHVCTA